MAELRAFSEEVKSFPNLTIVKASAGSGKTYFLTKTFVEFLLSDNIIHNELRNILAITFSNNAAIEIKEKILNWLKKLYFKEEDALKVFYHLNLSDEAITNKAGILIEKILDNYSDLQIRTIDSFLTKIFKAEAVRFGYFGDFDILMKNENFLHHAFENFLNLFKDKSEMTSLIMEIIDIIEENLTVDSNYIWNPGKKFFDELKNIYNLLSITGYDLSYEDIEKFKEYLKDFEKAKEKLKRAVIDFEKKVQDDGGTFRQDSKIPEIIESLKNDDFSIVIKVTFNKNPLKKSTSQIDEAWSNLKRAVADYVTIYCKKYFVPYFIVFFYFEENLKDIKRRQQKIFIEDVNNLIKLKLDKLSIPEIYIKLGERIYHYFIDEFQDTSPIQWNNLKMLIENSLSEGGSLLIVGDTKQAIYGFRGADYTIMTELIKEADSPQTFKSVPKYYILNLSKNYRSGGKILNFVKNFFKKELNEYLINISDEREYYVEDNNPTNSEFATPLVLSGLCDCEQQENDDLKEIGYVKIEKIEYEKGDKDEKEKKERKTIIQLINKIRKQGFSYSEIALLAFKNETLTNISTWLNEEGFDFLSYSSLDVRKRKIIAELVFLLKFLDSPVDDFSFSSFLLGDISKKFFSKDVVNWESKVENFLLSCNKKLGYDGQPYYKRFQKHFPYIWENYFSNILKKIGFLPLYDLLTEVYNRFSLFDNFPDEESALIKLLEVVLKFESEGSGLKKFIEFYETSGDEDERFWDVSKPIGKDAMTLMTVHQAKGLEFPAVILLTDINPTKIDKIVFDGNDFLKLPDDKTLQNEYLKRIKKVKNKFFNRNFTDDLNKLYVALTRAKEVLYVIVSCERKDENSISKSCPRKNQAVKCLYENKEYSIEQEYYRIIPEGKQENIQQILLNHFVNKNFFDYPLEEEPVNIYEIKKGEFIHKLMASILFIENKDSFEKDLKERIKKLNFEFKQNYDPEEIKTLIMKTINRFEKYFRYQPKREIYTEKEILDSDGNLHRIDRLIVDSDRITVMEYKFGIFPNEQKAINQTKLYMELLKELYFDRKIDGFIYLSTTDRIIKL
jgi:ATP-dependent helicase/nuclease subunit A